LIERGTPNRRARATLDAETKRLSDEAIAHHGRAAHDERNGAGDRGWIDLGSAAAATARREEVEERLCRSRAREHEREGRQAEQWDELLHVVLLLGVWIVMVVALERADGLTKSKVVASTNWSI
jgi:hypothetical protein